MTNRFAYLALFALISISPTQAQIDRRPYKGYLQTICDVRDHRCEKSLVMAQWLFQRPAEEHDR